MENSTISFKKEDLSSPPIQSTLPIDHISLRFPLFFFTFILLKFRTNLDWDFVFENYG